MSSHNNSSLLDRVITMVKSLQSDPDSIMSFDAIKRLRFYCTLHSDNRMWGDTNGVEAKTIRLLVFLRKSLNSPLGDLENAPAQDVSNSTVDSDVKLLTVFSGYRHQNLENKNEIQWRTSCRAPLPQGNLSPVRYPVSRFGRGTAPARGRSYSAGNGAKPYIFA